MLDGLVVPWADDTDFGVTIIQTDGLILYDTGARQVGKMPDDPLYQVYPELQETIGWVMGGCFGRGSYTFQSTVNKEVYWTTVGLHGRKWGVSDNAGDGVIVLRGSAGPTYLLHPSMIERRSVPTAPSPANLFSRFARLASF